MVSEFIASIILAIVQGITEWLPVSSSGHLVLLQSIFGFKDLGLEFDVALHFGTLMAVFVYFGQDIIDILRDILGGKWGSEKSKLGWMVVVATIPAAVIGLLLKKVFEASFTSLEVVAVGFAITGIVLMIGSLDLKKKGEFGYKKSFLVGCAQVIALFPGISRSGTTISSGLLLGLDEKKAIRFSFLMAIPAVIGANILELGNKNIPSSMFIPTFIAFLVGLATIHLLFRYMLSSRKNLRWFGAYALLLSLAIGIWLLFF